MRKIIAICGMAWSGKSTVTDRIERHGFARIHLGSTEKVIEKYGYTNETLEREMRELVRKEHWMWAMVIIMLDHIKKQLTAWKDVVIDNMYSRSEYKILKEEFGNDFISIAIHAKPSLRYNRLEERIIRPLTNLEARSRDHSEIENIEKWWPIAMSDYNIINESTEEHLDKEIEAILAHLHIQ